MPLNSRNSLHIQGWTKPSSVATIANWLMENGKQVDNMNQLVNQTFEVLADAIVDQGGKPITSLDEIEMVFEQIGNRRKEKLNFPALGSREMQVLAQQAIELMQKGTAYQPTAEAIEAEKRRAVESFKNQHAVHADKLTEDEREAMRLAAQQLTQQADDATYQEEK